MSGAELGKWEPLDIVETTTIFAEASFRWWVSGGRALELHLGRTWRDQEDSDVGVLRQDVALLSAVLVGWDIHAAAGRLEPWRGQELRADRHENNLWCRRHPAGAWSLDIVINEGDADEWVYRRDPQLRLAWREAVLATPGGVPYLAPELQLLFKSSDVRTKDDIDAREVIPELSTERRQRLSRLLPPHHRWQPLLRPLT